MNWKTNGKQIRKITKLGDYAVVTDCFYNGKRYFLDGINIFRHDNCPMKEYKHEYINQDSIENSRIGGLHKNIVNSLNGETTDVKKGSWQSNNALIRNICREGDYTITTICHYDSGYVLESINITENEAYYYIHWHTNYTKPRSVERSEIGQLRNKIIDSLY